MFFFLSFFLSFFFFLTFIISSRLLFLSYFLSLSIFLFYISIILSLSPFLSFYYFLSLPFYLFILLSSFCLYFVTVFSSESANLQTADCLNAIFVSVCLFVCLFVLCPACNIIDSSHSTVNSRSSRFHRKIKYLEFMVIHVFYVFCQSKNQI